MVFSVSIPNDALAVACDADDSEVELRCDGCVVDSRVDALIATLNAERVAGFPKGRLFLDSTEQALAVALLIACDSSSFTACIHGGLNSGTVAWLTELAAVHHTHSTKPFQWTKSAETTLKVVERALQN